MFTLDIPEDVVSAARRIAEATSQPLEKVLLNRLKSTFPLPPLPSDEEAELDALTHLSDDALWTLAREQLPDSVQEHMTILMDRNSRGTITPEEYAELEGYVDRGQRLMLRKSEASAVLTRRGYTITPKDLAKRE